MTTRGRVGHQSNRDRNSNRGIRSQEAIEKRRYGRNIKKNVARRNRRRINSRQTPPALEVREPGASPRQEMRTRTGSEAGGVGPPRVRPGMWMRMASMNMQGMKVVMQREEVEAWMVRRDIQVTVLQETHIPTTGVERRKRFTWYFSLLKGGGEGKNGRTFAGVAIVFK